MIMIQATEFSSLMMKVLENFTHNLVLVNVNYNKYTRERHQISYNQLAQLGLTCLGELSFLDSPEIGVPIFFI